MPIVTRRTILAATLALAIPPRPSAAATALRTRLVRLFRYPNSARAVGAAYLRLHPEVAAAERLTALLGADLGDDEGAALASRLAARQRADFGAGRTVVVEGWVLSLTEARICALLAAV